MNLFNLPVQQMDKEMAEMFIALTLLESKDQDRTSEIWKLDGDNEEAPTAFRMLYKHCKARGVNCLNTVIMFLGCGGTIDRPSHVSLYAEALMEHQQIDCETITMKKLAHLFPDGFPSIEELNKLWENKKQ